MMVASLCRDFGFRKEEVEWELSEDIVVRVVCLWDLGEPGGLTGILRQPAARYSDLYSRMTMRMSGCLLRYSNSFTKVHWPY